MSERTLDLFPTEQEVSTEKDATLVHQVFESNVLVKDIASSFKIGRFLPAKAKNAEQLYPHAPSLDSISDEQSRLQAQSVHKRLWLALNFPILPLAREIVLSSRPAVVVESNGNVQTVLVANVAALQTGIVRGMRLNSAYASAGDLEVIKRDPIKEQRTIERLATWALQYTSCVSSETPDALLLEIRGSLRLFGGARSLRRKMFAQLREMGVVATAAIAPTSLAALWLARSTGPHPNVRNLTILPRHLEKLPLSCLRWPENACNVLQDLGIRTVGECLRLPREGFARRIGIELLQELDRATGRAPQPRLQYVPHETYKGRCDFDMEVTSTSSLECLLEPLLDELELFLRSRTAGIQALKISLRHREHEPTRFILRFVVPVNLKQHLATVLHERLERLELPAPVLAAQILSGPLQSLESYVLNKKLFGPAGEAEEIPRLIEKLRARLGNDAVYTLRLTEDHRPERAYRVTQDFCVQKNKGLRSVDPLVLSLSKNGLWPEKNQGPSTSSGRAEKDKQTYNRPLWLLSPPEVLLSKRGQPHLDGPLLLEAGAERIEGGWWDDADIRRDYFVARDKKGVRLWIFRERGKWFLHGRFG